MKNELNINFVQGTFQEQDAREILEYLLVKKINFHNTRLFHLEERFGLQDEYSKKRLASLRESQVNLQEVLQHADLLGKNVRIKSEISIELVDDAPTLLNGREVEMAAD